MRVFTHQTADGASEPFLSTPSGFNPYTKIILANDLGGGTVTVEELSPNGFWVPVSTTVAMDAAGVYLIDSAPFYGRLVLTGATGAKLSAWVQNYADALASAQQARLNPPAEEVLP